MKELKKVSDFDPVLNSMEEFKGSFFFHAKPGTVERRFTVAGIAIEKKGLVKTIRRIYFGTAQCSKRDPFSKKIGRLISSGRAIQKPVGYISYKKGELPGKVFHEFVRNAALETLNLKG
jgi:hypothetical protein